MTFRDRGAVLASATGHRGQVDRDQEHEAQDSRASTAWTSGAGTGRFRGRFVVLARFGADSKPGAMVERAKQEAHASRVRRMSSTEAKNPFAATCALCSPGCRRSCHRGYTHPISTRSGAKHPDQLSADTAPLFTRSLHLVDIPRKIDQQLLASQHPQASHPGHHRGGPVFLNTGATVGPLVSSPRPPRWPGT